MVRSNENLQVSQARSGQWRRVQAIRFRALLDTPDAFGTTIEKARQFTETTWQERLDLEDRATFLATIGTQDAGMAVGAPYDQQAGLFGMWVAPETRGCGVSDALIQAVVQWARSQGYEQILLDVGDTNQAAITLYERHGFEPTGSVSTLDPPREHIKEHQRRLLLT